MNSNSEDVFEESAVYIKSDGSPLKGSDGGSHNKFPQLLHLDLKFDSLKGFLETVLDSLNQHAKQINIMQQDLNLKSYDKKMSQLMLQIANSLQKECGDRPSQIQAIKKMEAFAENIGSVRTDDERELEKSVDRVGEKMEIIGAHLLTLSKWKTDTTEKVESIEKELRRKLNIADFKERKRRLKKALNTKMTDAFAKLEEKFGLSYQIIENRVKGFEEKMLEIETNTLWKIRDCEDLLKSRVSERFVVDSVKAAEDRVAKSQNMQTYKIEEKYRTYADEINGNLKDVMSSLEDKLAGHKSNFQNLESMITKRATKFDIEEVNKKIIDLKKTNNSDLESVSSIIKVMEDRVSDLFRKINMSGALNQSGRQTPGDKGGQDEKTKRNQSDAKVMSLEDDIAQLKKNMKSMQTMFAAKADTKDVEMGLLNKVDRTEVVNLITKEEEQKENIELLVKQQLSEITRSMNDIAKTWDMKFVKLRNEFDFHGLVRLVDEKASAEDTRNAFFTMTSKLGDLVRALQQNTMQTEMHKSIIGKLHKGVNELQMINQDALVGKKNMNCLSCGKGELKPIDRSKSVIKGRDGKVYVASDSPKQNLTFGDFSGLDLEIGNFSSHRKASMDNINNTSARLAPQIRRPKSKGGYKNTRNYDVPPTGESSVKELLEPRLNKTDDSMVLQQEPKHSMGLLKSMNKLKLPIGFKVQNEALKGPLSGTSKPDSAIH